MSVIEHFCPIDTSGKFNRIPAAIHVLVMCFIAGLVIIVLFALGSGSLSDAFSRAGVGLLLAGGITLSGGLLGFLFGIPRTLQGSDQEGTVPGTSSGDQKNVERKERYKANTNLEQISDWLTKILVGVGLTQLVLLPDALQEYAAKTAPALGGLPNGGAFSIGILIFFSVDGFFIGYLWTRRYFASELTQTDLELLTLEADKIFRTEREKQDNNNAEALKVVERVLLPSTDMSTVSQDDLNKKIFSASKFFKAMIFYKTENLRRNNWQYNKPTMERTEKIFRALIASDTENRYHSSHGQLGFVLKDKRKPEWEEAVKELTRAIEIRGRWQDNPLYLYYEFCRAVCNINLDAEGFVKGKQSTDIIRNRIVNDLEDAANHDDIKRIMSQEPSIVKWKELNDYPEKLPSGADQNNETGT